MQLNDHFVALFLKLQLASLTSMLTELLFKSHTVGMLCSREEKKNFLQRCDAFVQVKAVMHNHLTKEILASWIQLLWIVMFFDDIRLKKSLIL